MGTAGENQVQLGRDGGDMMVLGIEGENFQFEGHA